MTIEHQPITLVIAEFEDIVSLGLQSMVDDDANLRLIAGDIAREQIAPTLRAHSPDVAILNFASLAAPAQLRELSDQFPDIRLVVLANNPSSGEARQLIGFGATACLAKSTEARDVIQAIYLASRGMHVLPPDAEQDYEPSGPAPLTPREADVLELLRAGAANAEIAVTLQVGIETVRTHARHIYRKLGVSTRRELRSTQ